MERRISATFKDLPGGQVLGPTFDYTHRLLDPGLAGDPDLEAVERRPADAAAAPRVTDLLGDQGLIEPDAGGAGEPGDLTRVSSEFLMDCDMRL